MALHEVQLKGYSVRPGNLSLGTFDSYGIEQLHVTLDDTWSGLAIDATFHNAPNDKGVTMLLDTDGLVTVPPEACKQPSKYATITFRGVQDGVQRISCNLPYVVLDHAQVPGANSTATPSENAQALAQMQALRDGAVDAKNQAKAARDDAARSAVAAKEYETNAGQSATAAKTAQSAAETAKAGAETAQKAAASSASSASTSASTATTQAAAAKSSAIAAKASETTAGKSAQEAAASAANLDSAVNTATQKAAAASASAEAAKASESAAASSEAAARKYANSAELAAKTAGEAAAEKLQQMQAIQDDVTAKQAQTATDATAAEKAKVAAEAAQNGAAASETAAADSAAAAKASEDAAAKSAADADSTANSIKKRQNVLVGSETGNPIAVDDAFAAPLCGLTVYGKSTQDGTPSPDNPVPIVSAGDGGSVAVRVTGKNLLNPALFQNNKYQGFNAETGYYGIDSVNGYWITGIQPCLPSTTYHFNAMIEGGCFYDEKKNVIGIADFAFTIKTPAKCAYYCFNFSSAHTSYGTPIIATVSESTAYSPYREQLLTLPTPNGLPGIPVTSGGNYTDQNGQQWVCDEVDLERGVKVQRVNAVDLSTCVITGTTNLATTKRIAIRLPLKGKDYKVKALCNRLPYLVSFTSDTIHFYVDTNNAQVFIPIGAKNPEEGEYILFYALATPIETPLTPAEIAAYKALTAYAPDTVVQASDGAGLKLDYQRDVNIVIKNLEDAIASMTTT